MDINTTTASYIPVTTESQYGQIHRISRLTHDDQQQDNNSHDENLPPSYLATPTSHMSNVTQTLELNSLPSITLPRGTDITMNTPTATFQLEIPQNLATSTAQPLPMLWFTSPTSRNSQGHVQLNDIMTPVSDGTISVGMGSVTCSSASISEVQQSEALPAISEFSSRDLDTKGTRLQAMPVDIQTQTLDGIVTSVGQLLVSSSEKASAEAAVHNIYSMAPSQINGGSRELIPTSYTLTHGVLSSPLIGQNKQSLHLHTHGMNTNQTTLVDAASIGKSENTQLSGQIITLPAHVVSNMVNLGLNQNSGSLASFQSHNGPHSVNLQSMGDVSMSLLTSNQGGHVSTHSLTEIAVVGDGDSKLRQMLLRPLPASGTGTTRSQQQDAPRKLDGFVEQVPCYKCKLCPFISLSRSGVKDHVKSVHVHVVLSSDDESEDEGDVLQPMDSPSTSSSSRAALPSVSVVEVVLDDNAEGNARYSNQEQMDTRVVKRHMRNVEAEGDGRKITGSLAKRRKVWAGGDNTKSTEGASQGTRTQSAADDGKLETENDMEDDTDTAVMAEEVDDDELSNDEPSTSGKAKCSKRRGRPKGSKTVGVTAMRKKNPKVKINEEEIGFRCWVDSCAIRLKAQENLEYHRKCHSDQGFECPECKQTFEHWRNISVHLWRSHLIDMELYACDQCSYKTYSISKLMNMHKKIHSDERPFLCDTCGKGFKTNKQLRNHKVIHLDKKRQRSLRSGECDICHRYFSDKRMLRVHKDTVHNKLRPFLCNFCGYSASCRSTLKMHMRQHTGEKPFACDICEYKTADHNSLRRHKMRHSGEKPYKCPFCTYACIQSSTYKTHLKNKHPGQDEGLMFSCNVCSFRTIKRENFVTHVADHKNEALQGAMPVTTTLVVSTGAQQQQQQQQHQHHDIIAQHNQQQEVQMEVHAEDGTTHNATISQIEGIMAPNMGSAQFVFTSLEDLRERINQGNFTVEAPVTEERFPILAGQLKIGQLDGEQHTHIVHASHVDLVDANVHHLHITTNEHLVHEHGHNVEQIIIKHIPRNEEGNLANEHEDFSGRDMEGGHVTDQVDPSSGDHIIT